ncbi:MAG: hypothetical protein HYX71_02470 [Opitutae bacterium]|nr:hypothetical protein [Opitutae bacterium]
MKHLLLRFGLVFLGANLANSQTSINWNSTSGTDFATGSNWSGGVAPANDLTSNIASFTSATGAVGPVLAANRSVAGLSFLAGGTGSVSFVLSGSATLTLGSTGISQTAGRIETISLPLVLGAAQSWINTGTNGTLNVTGAVDLNGFSLGIQTGAGGATSSVNLTGVIRACIQTSWNRIKRVGSKARL